MKLAIVGFVLLCGIIGLSNMYSRSQTEMASNAQQAQAVQQSRPHDLSLLKRADVRTACTKHADWDIDSCRAIDEREVSVGMTAEQARLAWGKPERVNSTTSSEAERDQWVYGSGSYLYIDNGVVRSVQTSR